MKNIVAKKNSLKKSKILKSKVDSRLEYDNSIQFYYNYFTQALQGIIANYQASTSLKDAIEEFNSEYEYVKTLLHGNNSLEKKQLFSVWFFNEGLEKELNLDTHNIKGLLSSNEIREAAKFIRTKFDYEAWKNPNQKKKWMPLALVQAKALFLYEDRLELELNKLKRSNSSIRNKQEEISFQWGNSNKKNDQLDKLFKLLIKPENNFIDPNTNRESFQIIFSNQAVKNKINWISNLSHLIYFYSGLTKRGLIVVPDDIDVFVESEDLSKSQKQIFSTWLYKLIIGCFTNNGVQFTSVQLKDANNYLTKKKDEKLFKANILDGILETVYQVSKN